MFGGLYPEGQGEAHELLADLTLEKIDYDWIKAQKKPNYLKKAIKLIEDDGIDEQCFQTQYDWQIKKGNYFADMKEACIKQLTLLDPSKAPKVFNNIVNESERRKLDQEINSWEKDVSEKEQKQKTQQKIFELDQQPDNGVLSEDMRKLKAENEKNKGNEALKSKDFKEAIEYYTKSIEYDPKLAASYCNRALVYLKLKDYEKVVKDCNIAIEIDRNYLKAYHRRGKARFAQDKVYEAYCDFKFIMEKEPDNKEVNGDLKECQDLLKQQNLNPEKGFKRVQIVEEDDEEEEEAEEQKNEQNKVANNESTIPIVIDAVVDAQKRSKYEQQINQIETEKDAATVHIKNGGYDKSILILKKCIHQIDILGPFSQKEEDTIEFKRKKASYLNNISLCYKQIDDNKHVVEYTSQVIKMKAVLSSDVLVKAYLRRGLEDYIEKIFSFKANIYNF